MKKEFTIKGWLYGPVSVTWKNGTLSCEPPEMLETIQRQIEKLEEINAFFLCPETGLIFSENYLAEPFSAYLVLKHLLETVYEAPDKHELIPTHKRFSVMQPRR
jgi:hypothetical protein